MSYIRHLLKAQQKLNQLARISIFYKFY